MLIFIRTEPLSKQTYKFSTTKNFYKLTFNKLINLVNFKLGRFKIKHKSII